MQEEEEESEWVRRHLPDHVTWAVVLAVGDGRWGKPSEKTQNVLLSKWLTASADKQSKVCFHLRQWYDHMLEQQQYSLTFDPVTVFFCGNFDGDDIF